MPKSYSDCQNIKEIIIPKINPVSNELIIQPSIPVITNMPEKRYKLNSPLIPTAKCMIITYIKDIAI